MAYVNLDNEIVVEKIVTFADSSKGGSAETIEEIESIIFASTSDGTYATNPVTYLSMTGDSTNKALYIAYMAEVNGNDLVHIRRIDISGGKTAFSHDGKFGYDPDNATTDDILNNITLGANLSSVFDATTGSLLITVGAPLDATATTIQFDNLNEGSGSVTLTEDIEFCLLSTCSTIALSAQSIADAINASAELELQGLTATSDGVDTVTVEGIYQTDFLELDIRAGALGDIMINKTSDRWEIPYIDADKAAGDKFKISIYSGDLGIRLSNCNDTSVLLAGTVPAQELANDILESDKDADAADDQGLAIGDTDKVLIAVKALSSGEIQLYEYDNGYALLETNADLFSDDDVTDIKLNISQNSSNTNAFLVGRNSSSAIAFARISHTAGDFDVAGAETILDLDNDFELIENDNASEYDIAAGTTSNQALFLSVDTANSVAYLSTIQSNGLGSATIDCSYDSDQDLTKCMKIQTVTGDSVFDLGVTLGDAVEGVTLGVDGDTAGESTNDIIPLVYHINDGGGNPAADAIPVLGIININGVNFSNDNTAFGANYIIPYVND